MGEEGVASYNGLVAGKSLLRQLIPGRSPSMKVARRSKGKVGNARLVHRLGRSFLPLLWLRRNHSLCALAVVSELVAKSVDREGMGASRPGHSPPSGSSRCFQGVGLRLSN